MGNPADAYLDQTIGGRYKLAAHIADGHFSHVYKAVDQQTGALTAVKVLQPAAALDPPSAFEFQREGQLLESLRGARNVVVLTGSGTSEVGATITAGQPAAAIPVSYHALELADGVLSELLAHRHQIGWDTKMRIFRGVVLGIHQMHLKKIVHRDVKAANVLLFDTHTRTPTAKVSDLGRSRDLAQPAAFPAGAYAQGRGDLSYAPPEHLWQLGLNDPVSLRRADIYLLGSSLYEIATGISITSVTLPHWQWHLSAAANLSLESRKTSFFAAARHIAELHETVAQPLLAGQVAAEILRPVASLIRQMCHPLPDRREHRFSAERNHPAWGLQWVLRRIDIITKHLQQRKTTSTTTRRRQR